MKKILGYIVIAIFGFLIVYSYHTQPSTNPLPQSKVDPLQDRSPLIIAQVETSPYLSFANWPPVRQEVPQAYSCTQGGTPITQEGSTSERIVNDALFCVTENREGAAGSTYYEYTYLTSNGESTSVSYSFSVRMVQCMNYDEPSVTECQVQQAAFNPDVILQDYFSQG